MYFTENEWTTDRIVLGLRAWAEDHPEARDLLVAAADEIAGPDLTVNLEGNTVTAGGKIIKLTPKEAEILEVLKTGRQVTTDRLYSAVWPITEDLTSPSGQLAVHICRINKKIAHTPYRICSEWGCGYQIRRTEDHGHS